MTTESIVFLGPSIPKARVPEVPFEIRPPVRQGDVIRALDAGAKRIGIIDGYFDQVPSVWHKEILLAIEEGVVVYGASSMGALRAAELHTFGMIGVGRVFEMYRDGILEDDDEVALLHSPAEDGYRAISEAMVNLRDHVDAAVLANVIERAVADDALATLKALPYPARTVRKLVELAPALASFVKEPRTPLKERDALALFERMKKNEDAPLPVEKRTRVERTIFLERLRHESRTRTNREPSMQRDAREVLASILAIDHAVTIGATPSPAETTQVMRQWMEERGLTNDEELARFLDENALDVDRFLEHIREEATVRRLEIVYQKEIDERLEELARRK